MAADGEIKYQIVIDDKGAAKVIDGVKESAEETGKKGDAAFGNMQVAAAKFAAFLASAAIVNALGDIGKAAIDAYADYEQLVGGVETLFKESAPVVQQYAANAYKTAGLSANQYMETVTSFSASLLQSLGGDTEEAARVADMAITDMADNANKMGSDMSAIQTAYQGFAKQNYTMLDNLKIGYGGTKTEMERLIKDANALKVANGQMADLTIDSYANIVEAIHLVQTEMDITGTTAKEADATISGSAASMKAAWENMLIGMVDAQADKTKLMVDLFKSIKTYISNMLPAIGQLIRSFISTLPGMMNMIMEIVLDLIDDIVDNLPTLITSLVECLTNLVQVIINRAPEILAAGVKLIVALGMGLVQAIPQLIQNVPGIIESLFDAIVSGVPQIIEAGIRLMMGLEEGEEMTLPQVLDFIASIPSRILSALGYLGNLLWDAGSQIISGLLGGLTSAFSGVQEFVGGVGSWIVEHKGPEQYDKQLLVKPGKWIMESLGSGLRSGLPGVLDELNDITSEIQGYSVNANLQPSASSGVFNTTTVVNINGISSNSPSVLEAASSLVSAVQLDLRMGVA